MRSFVKIFCCLLVLVPLNSRGTDFTGVVARSMSDQPPARNSYPAVAPALMYKVSTDSRPEMLRVDKVKHLTTSLMMVVTIGYYAGNFTDLSPEVRLQYAVGGTLAAGIGKELWDRQSAGGSPSWRDLLADILGCFCGAVILHNMP